MANPLHRRNARKNTLAGLSPKPFRNDDPNEIALLTHIPTATEKFKNRHTRRKNRHTKETNWHSNRSSGCQSAHYSNEGRSLSRLTSAATGKNVRILMALYFVENEALVKPAFHFSRNGLAASGSNAFRSLTTNAWFGFQISKNSSAASGSTLQSATKASIWPGE